MPRYLICVARDVFERIPRHYGSLSQALAAAGFGLMTVAVAVSLLRPPVTTVHAASKGDKTVGAALFHQSGCEYCHGSDGRGTDRGPDLGTVGRRLTKERIEQQIREGGGGMPAWGDALQPDQIEDLVAFLHEKRSASKKPKQKPPAPPAPNGSGAEGTSVHVPE